jgi:hypothetical protein
MYNINGKDEFETFVDRENMGLLRLVWSILWYNEFMYGRIFNKNAELKFVVTCSYPKGKKHIEMFGFELKERQDANTIKPLYICMTDDYIEIDICKMVLELYQMIRRYEIQTIHLAMLIQHLYKVQLNGSAVSDVCIKVCDENTLEEQIFKANDIVYI